ncbi:MAG: imidazole glycerol phosphate synthase cyclase subunit [Ilumatobacteraceae bacterium]|nr:MAG: imidazole glycerol phosphate synthase subunit HisF [Acidimicrobium sp. BACL27 MAG-120823-bin4]MDP4981987.1 imidazole glycerol phosphate synthase cyclase subunit [Ilumatobacteraceae bacterium]
MVSASPSQVKPQAVETALRLIARLDIKGANLIKGIHLEGLRVVGDPQIHAAKYYQDGADEIVYMDTVASLYGRNNLVDVVSRATEHVFVPITVGGGIRSVEDARTLLRAGADKIAINTAAIKDPKLIRQLSDVWGSSTIVLSIEAKKTGDNKWEAYTDNGRERTGLDVAQWAETGAKLGAGEIFVTSVDQEGTRKGFDCELVAEITKRVEIPVIASGGFGSLDHLSQLVKTAKPTGVAIADSLHYNRYSFEQIRSFCLANGISTRNFRSAAKISS